MTNGSAWLLVALMTAAGCRHVPLRPIEPAVKTDATLLVPLLHGDVEKVIAELRVPSGYGPAPTVDGSIDFWRGKGDPDIWLVSAFAAENGQRRPPDFIEDDCTWTRNGEQYDSRPRFDHNPNGTILVCQDHEPQPSVGVLRTLVVRDFQWHGDRFQCQVRFDELGDLGAPYDHGKPSPARIEDAIAICDSMTLRPAPAQGSNASGGSGSEDPP